MFDISERQRSNSVISIMAIMEHLALHDGWVGPRALARDLGMSPATAHRYLATLTDTGYARQDPVTGQYALTLKVAWLSSQVLQRVNLINISRPHIEALQKATSETIHIGVLDNIRVVCVDKVDSNQPVQLRSAVGRQMLIHATSLGRAILAYLGEKEREAILAHIDQPAITQRTITSIEGLRQELEQVKLRGYAIDDEESQAGIRCVGAPLFDHTGNVVAALSISGWTITMTRDRIPQLAEQVKTSAYVISRDLGYNPEHEPVVRSGRGKATQHHQTGSI